MRIALPSLSGVVDKSDVRFVDESGCIEGFFAVPLTSLSPRDLVQLVIDERKQLCESLAVSRPHLVEETIHDVLVSVTH
jgi:hypothetical protein